VGSMRHRELTLKLVALTVGMFGFGYALVPLYDVFCALTGLGGKTANTAQAVEERPDESRSIRVEFLASLGEFAPWEFRPEKSSMVIHPGKLYEATYYARNLTDGTLVGQAVPSVAPGEAAEDFKKVECFCFTQQTFAPHEAREMKVVFMLDPELPSYLDTVTLSYTFFGLSD